MASEKAIISENVQKYLGKSDWKSAIVEMEKLFRIDQDPIIRVRIGDARLKMNLRADAVKEYIRAADLYAEKGFVVKALAQYKLAIRHDPANKDAQDKVELLHTNKTVSELKLEPIEDGAEQPTRSVIPLFSDFTQDEFNEFTKRMIISTIPAGRAIIKEGAKGSSVYILTRGSVKVYAMVAGKRIDLAVLQPSDFFGEIAYLTGQPRTATVEAIEESDVLELAEEDLNELIAKSPRIKDVLKNYHEQRVKNTLEKVKEVI
ncbi:MAG TPA: cyclic nucleotide-binding domain-containing protein [Nitrospirota bacterium]|nr:cyclic nucleotide-binding domain-containing protein [Nitrospirota bacterium]